MTDAIRNVLFLCTGNSARSILAEALIDHWGQGRFKGYSAGSFPKGTVNPLAIELLSQFGLPIEDMRSKSWDEFAVPGAPVMDFVFTVCDQAAGEQCPVWPGHPITAHWGVPDPAGVEGSKAMQMLAFRQAFSALERRVKLFLDLRVELDRKTMQARVRKSAASMMPPRKNIVTGSSVAPSNGLVRVVARAALAELIATSFLLIAVVGSGIMAERLCGGNIGLALLANAIATGGALVALILAFGPQSGAHMNPVVTLAAAATGGLKWHAVPAYIGAQIIGAIVGVWLAHVMFELPILQISQHVRTGPAQWVAEIVATFGLLMVIWGCRAYRAPVTPFAVAAYITGAYWFTASTSFANPAVTIARALSDTFAGIRPIDMPGFILAQLVALALALPILRWHAPPEQDNNP